MSTRKLILVALVCGLAILIAGGVQLVLLAGRDDESVATLLDLGEVADLDGIDVTVESSARTGDQVDVHVRYASGSAVEDAADGWFVLGGGDLIRPLTAVTPGGCPGQSVAGGQELECSLSFPTDDATVTVGYAKPGDAHPTLWRLSR